MQNLDVSTVVFAVVAIFVIFKLRSVLGTRTGAERRPLDPTTPARGDPPVANGNVIPIGGVARTAGAPPPADRWKGFAEKGSPLAAGLDAILAAEPGFTAGDFLSGARAAYEMIIVAFAAGDLATLRRLLTPDALANFATAIQARKAAEQKTTMTLASIEGEEMEDEHGVGTSATLSLRFASKLLSASSDRAGAGV